MAIESACIPLPSELILPMAGWMVAQGKFDLWWATIAGTMGCTIGSAVAYWVGAWGGRPLVMRFGKYVLISAHDLDRADRWFARYGDWAIFFSRMMPVVRTFISFPAGVARMNFPRFLLYTTLGSLPWTLGLVYVGKVLGNNWKDVRHYLQGLDYLILAVIVLLVALYVYRHVRHAKAPAR
jgi:membrane protein DedA with SNARE-associated domain